MILENSKIYLDNEVIAIIDSSREVVEIFDSHNVSSVLDFLSDSIYRMYSWETYNLYSV